MLVASTPRREGFRGLFGVALLACIASPVLADADTPLTWRDLVNRPERWPAEVKLKADMTFSKGEVVKAGTPLKVHNVSSRAAQLLAPQGFVFDVTPADCDLLEAANADWAKLTPEQKALTIQSIQKDKSLWPGKVTITVGANFRTFKLSPGETYRLVTMQGNDLGLFVPGRPGLQLMPVSSTDLFARAREIAATPQAQRQGRVFELLDGLLVDNDGNPVPVQPAEYYVHYISASTCPRCAIFTPKLVDHVKQNFANRKDVLFFGSSTDTEGMKPYFAYAQRTGMPWSTLPDEMEDAIKSSYGLRRIEIPGVIVMDKFGNVLLATPLLRGTPLQAADQALEKLDAAVAPRS